MNVMEDTEHKSIRIAHDDIKKIEQIRGNERRSFSMMAAILINEALKARKAAQ